MPITEDPDPRPSPDQPEQPEHQADDPFAGLVLDEEFVQGAAVKEQSGRARMLSAQWKRQPPPEPEPWRPPTEIRRSRFARRAKVVDPWGNPQRRRRRNWQTPLFLALVAAVVVAGLNVDRLHAWYNADDSATTATPARPKAAPTTQAPETAAPSAAPPTQAPDTPTVAHPWAGSPAESWPAGADAIALPQATAVGVFGASQVAQRLQMVKDYLVAANLDPATLAGKTPQTALDLLDQQDRDQLAAALAHPTKDADPTDWISRFNPRTALPAGDVVKAQGHLSFESDGDHGLLVHTDFTYVYALVPGPEVFRPSSVASPGSGSSSNSSGGGANSVAWVQAGGTEVTREIVRRSQDFRFYDPARYDVPAKKLVLGQSQADFGNNYCEMGDGWLEPEFPQSRVGADPSSPSGPTTDPYDHSKPLDRKDGACGTLSRS